VEGPEEKGGKHESLESQDGEGATGTVNVGVSATTVNIATTGPTGGGNVTLGTGGSTGGVFTVNSVGTSINSYNTDIGNFGNNAVVVNVGYNGAGKAGTVNIGKGATAVNIGTTTSTLISIGNATGTVALSGTTSVTTLDGSASGTVMLLGNNLTTGSMYFANSPTFSGTISIGANSSSRTGDINIGTLGSGNIGIGNTGAALTLRGSSTTFSSALTLGAAPTSAAQLGGIVMLPIADGSTLTQSTVLNIKQFAAPATGIYYVSYSITVNSTVTITKFQAYIQNNLGGQQYGASSVNASQPTDGTFWTAINGSAIISLNVGDSIATKYLFSSSAAASTGLSSYMMYARVG